MTIDKRPSGKYRIRHRENGKDYSITVPFKPTAKEAYELIQDKIKNVSSGIAFADAYKQYIDVKSNVLSPATIRGYNSIFRNMPEWFTSMDIASIDRLTCQKLVNEYSTGHSAKSTANLNGLVQAVLRLFYPESHISVTLPRKPHIEPYAPSYDEVKRLLDYVKDTDDYVPLYLMSLSLRLSEVCALTIKDLSGNTIKINKGLVKAERGYILKDTPKTDASNREVVIPESLAERIKDQGYIYRGYPNQINKHLTKYLDELGIEHFSVHKLRHFFCSYTHDLGYTDAQIKKIGGWDSDVFKRVYRHAMNEDDAQKSIAQDFTF